MSLNFPWRTAPVADSTDREVSAVLCTETQKAFYVSHLAPMGALVGRFLEAKRWERSVWRPWDAAPEATSHVFARTASSADLCRLRLWCLPSHWCVNTRGKRKNIIVSIYQVTQTINDRHPSRLRRLRDAFCTPLCHFQGRWAPLTLSKL